MKITSENLEIVIVFVGYQPYVLDAIKQLSFVNPGKTIHFIGDRKALPEELLKIIKFYQIEDLICQDFVSIYKNYVNYSTNNMQFERINIVRWILIRNLALAKGFQKVFATDCDILYYESVEEGFKRFNNYKFTLCANTSAHTTFINDLSVLEDYVKLLKSFYDSSDRVLIAGREIDINFYRDLLLTDFHARNKHGKMGGISDMTFWNRMKLFYPAGQVGEMCEIKEDSTYDHTVSEEDGFEMDLENKIKNIIFDETRRFPEVFNNFAKKKIKFNSLHFQGSAKNKMSKFLLN